ncbi:hypothetical protein M3Y98_00091300 [Aphelenchoides besseyi]|nr:hypothetical protein M3Y98_00091300 [Aphelenchoides besseyi]
MEFSTSGFLRLLIERLGPVVDGQAVGRTERKLVDVVVSMVRRAESGDEIELDETLQLIRHTRT